MNIKSKLHGLNLNTGRLSCVGEYAEYGFDLGGVGGETPILDLTGMLVVTFRG